MKVIVLSAHRCGSLIIQNLGYIVLYGKQGVLKKYHRFAKVKKDVKVLIPIRDPRDVAVSYYRVRQFKKRLEDNEIKDIGFLKTGGYWNKNVSLMGQLTLMRNLYLFYKDRPNALILRYEDLYANGLGNYNVAVEMIADFLDKPVTDHMMNVVNSELSYDKLLSLSDRMLDGEDIGEDARFGLKSMGGHISNDGLSSWRRVVDDSLHKKLTLTLNPIIRRLDY